MSTVTIYHNPRCSKSRQTLALIQEKGVEPTVIEYLNAPPTPEEMDSILDLLGMEPRELMRRKEATYKETGADDPNLDRDSLVAILTTNPILIERPIVLANGKAALGRPPENVLEIL